MKVSKEHIIANSILSKRERIIGVYFLINKEDEIVYIGSGENVLARIAAHKKDNRKIFNRHFIIQLLEDNRKERHDLERYYVEQFLPKYNKHYNPRYERIKVAKGESFTYEFKDIKNN